MEISNDVKTKFRDYMEKEVPGYNNLLDEKVVEELLNDYNKWETWKKTADVCMERGMNSNSGINYANDFEKAMEKAAIEGNNFKRNIDDIKEIYGIKSEDIKEGRQR